MTGITRCCPDLGKQGGSPDARGATLSPARVSRLKHNRSTVALLTASFALLAVSSSSIIASSASVRSENTDERSTLN